MTTDLCLQAWDGVCDQGTIGGHLTGRAAKAHILPFTLELSVVQQQAQMWVL